MILKAVAGGGGRGARIVTRRDELAEAYARCQSEATSAFGNGSLFAEELLPRARHIEVQIVGDGRDVSHLWERECSLQRRHQKLIEMAPSPTLADRPCAGGSSTTPCASPARWATRASARSSSSSTPTATGDDARYVFLEANPRLQVEHTVTEEVLGLDLVRAQLELAGGADAGRPRPRPGVGAGAARHRHPGPGEHGDDEPGRRHPPGQRRAHRLRGAVGRRLPHRLVRLRRLPHQHQLRLAAGQGHRPHARRAGWPTPWPRPAGPWPSSASRAWPPTPSFLQAILAHPDVVAGAATTRFVDDHLPELVAPAPASRPRSTSPPTPATAAGAPPGRREARQRRSAGRARLRPRPAAAGAAAGRPPAAGAARRPGRHHRRAPRRCRARSCRSPWPRASRCGPASSCSSWKP